MMGGDLFTDERLEQVKKFVIEKFETTNDLDELHHIGEYWVYHGDSSLDKLISLYQEEARERILKQMKEGK